MKHMKELLGGKKKKSTRTNVMKLRDKYDHATQR
jgi:hypothetical protein